MIRLVADTSGFGDNLRRFIWMRGAVTFMDRAGPELRSAIKREAPVGEGPGAGRLRDSVRYSRSTRAILVRGEFRAHTPYTRYVVDGTRPHIIRPVAARALHWRDAGGDHFARLVRHPGTRPNPFARRAADRMHAQLKEWFREAIDNELKGH